MPRSWILSFAAVAIAVGAILFFTREEQPKKQPGPIGEQTYPQSITTNDVLKYLEVQPKINAITDALASADDPTRVDIKDRIREVLTLNSLSEASWDELWKRVENAINGVRAEKESPARIAKIQARIDAKKAALAAAGGKLKEQIEKDLAGLEAARDRAIRPIHPSDREVIMRFWDQLNRIAPRVKR